MLTRTRLAKAVFGLGAAISGTWAFFNVRALAEMYESGGGGFVSSVAIDTLKYVVPAAIAFWLAMRVRDRSRSIRLLRRAHLFVSFTIVLLLLLLMVGTFGGAFTSGLDGPWRAVLVGAFIGVAVWLPVQVFFVAVFSGLLIKQGALGGATDRSL
jgi:hypothetical protein